MNKNTTQSSSTKERRRRGDMTTAEIATIIAAGYEPGELVSERAIAELAGCSRSALHAYRCGREQLQREPTLPESLWLHLMPMGRGGRPGVFYFRAAVPVIRRLKAEGVKRTGRGRAVAQNSTNARERERMRIAKRAGIPPGQLLTTKELARAIGCTGTSVQNYRTGYRYTQCEHREPLLVEGEDFYRAGRHRYFYVIACLEKIRAGCNDTTPVRHYNAPQARAYA